MRHSEIENGQIITTIELLDNKVIRIEDEEGIRINPRGLMFNLGRGKQSSFTEQEFIDSGWLPHDYDVPAKNEYPGTVLIIEETKINRENTVNTTSEFRTSLENEAYRVCNSILSAAVGKYSNAEMSQWAEMVRESLSENWSYFDSMATPGLTGEQYAAVVLQKYTAYKSLFDASISARNTHKVNIDAAADDDLINYDVYVGWPTL